MTLHLFSRKRQFTTEPKHISSVIRIGMLPSRSGEGINSWMKTERNKNATFIVQFMCEFQWICPLLRQFKPTRKNDQVDGWTSGMKTDRRHREENFVARITDTFFIRVHTECARNWRTGSGQRFVQPIFSTRAIRRHFTVDVVVINWSRLMTCVASNEKRATCACQKNDGRIVDVWCGTVRSSCVYVRHMYAAASDCRLIHGIYFIRRLCTLLASIRCTFLCCARSTSSSGHYANIILFTM